MEPSKHGPGFVYKDQGRTGGWGMADLATFDNRLVNRRFPYCHKGFTAFHSKITPWLEVRQNAPKCAKMRQK